MKPKKAIPKFASEDAERRFWATHDSTEYMDWSKAKRILSPSLKPSANAKPTRKDPQ